MANVERSPNDEGRMPLPPCDEPTCSLDARIFPTAPARGHSCPQPEGAERTWAKFSETGRVRALLRTRMSARRLGCHFAALRALDDLVIRVSFVIRASSFVIYFWGLTMWLRKRYR